MITKQEGREGREKGLWYGGPRAGLKARNNNPYKMLTETFLALFFIIDFPYFLQIYLKISYKIWKHKLGLGEMTISYWLWIYPIYKDYNS